MDVCLKSLGIFTEELEDVNSVVVCDIILSLAHSNTSVTFSFEGTNPLLALTCREETHIIVDIISIILAL